MSTTQLPPLCSCGTRGCDRTIDPDVDGLDAQLDERLTALETKRAYAEMNSERLDDQEAGWGDGQRERVAEISAEIAKIMSDNHIKAADYLD